MMGRREGRGEKWWWSCWAVGVKFKQQQPTTHAKPSSGGCCAPPPSFVVHTIARSRPQELPITPKIPPPSPPRSLLPQTPTAQTTALQSPLQLPSHPHPPSRAIVKCYISLARSNIAAGSPPCHPQPVRSPSPPNRPPANPSCVQLPTKTRLRYGPLSPSLTRSHSDPQTVHPRDRRHPQDFRPLYHLHQEGAQWPYGPDRNRLHPAAAEGTPTAPPPLVRR